MLIGFHIFICIIIVTWVNCLVYTKMDVRSSNENDRTLKKYENNIVFNKNSTQFSLETYFIWFSALIFITELSTDFFLASYYFHKNYIKWGLITLGIILVPWMLYQVYSFFILKKEQKLTILVIFLHFLFLGIPYRYYSILKKIDKEKINNQEYGILKNRIHEINTIQIINSLFQYLPQFLFQTYLISFKKYKCVFTGVSAGLAGFSFLWYLFIHFYYVIKRCGEKKQTNKCNNSNQQIIDNLSSSHIQSLNINHNLVQNMNCRFPNNTNTISSLSSQPSSTLTTSTTATMIQPLHNNIHRHHQLNNEKNLYNKKHFEKDKIFYFNKRKPIYKKNDDEFATSFDYDLNNQSLEFYEVNENEHTLNNTNQYHKSAKEIVKHNNKGADSNEVTESRGSLLKRKGICSSQEMLHLVDIMNDNITPDQIDILAKNLADMSGDESLNPSVSNKEDSIDDNDLLLLDNKKLMELFPNNIILDDKIIENIDAAIYENQIIFEKRIHKNQLTIQNLKLQDEILSNDIKLNNINQIPETVSIHDYENMYFTEINRLNRLKHWRNYLYDLDTNLIDNNSTLDTSYYIASSNQNTTSQSTNSNSNQNVITNPNDNSNCDLYINEIDNSINCKLGNSHNKKFILNIDDDDNHLYQNLNKNNCDNNINDNDKMVGSVGNILVETINKINIDSPIKRNTQTHHNYHFNNGNNDAGNSYSNI